MTYSDLSYPAKKQAELAVLAIVGSEKEMQIAIDNDYFEFDMDGNILTD